jgi:hypothetical protein
MNLRELAQAYLEAEKRRNDQAALQQSYCRSETPLRHVSRDSGLAIQTKSFKISRFPGRKSEASVATLAWPLAAAERDLSHATVQRAATVETAATIETSATAATLAPSETLATVRQTGGRLSNQLNPRIRREPPFGLDHVPPRYEPAWRDLLAQCPAGVTPYVWQAAIFNTAGLFGHWGELLDPFGFMPGNLFDVPCDDKPGGLVWFIKGSPIVNIGRQMAQCQDGRIWRIASR